MVSTESHACSRVEIVPNEVAGPVCAQTSPTACWADISFDNGGSSLFVTRHLAELDLNVTGTVVVLGRRTYDVGVQERLLRY